MNQKRELQKTNQEIIQAHNQLTTSLAGCISQLGDENRKTDAKMQLMERVSDLMPQGKPNFEGVRLYPSIEQLKGVMSPAALRTVIYMLVVDFCKSLNVKRAMSDDQMLECACMLYDKCDTFRLEDYVMMFTMAKRAEIGGDLYSSIDISTIGRIMNEYWAIRDEAAEKLLAQEMKVNDDTMDERLKPLAKALEGTLKDWEREISEEYEAEKDAYRKKQIEGYAKLHNVNMEEVIKQFKK